LEADDPAPVSIELTKSHMSNGTVPAGLVGRETLPNRLDPRHPYGYTENALREEMGLPSRSRYGDT